MKPAIKDITGWQDELKAMYEDGRYDATYRNNPRCGIVDGKREGHWPQIPLSEVQNYIDTLLVHDELRPALEARMIYDLWFETLDPKPEFEFITDHATFVPRKSHDLLRQFKTWYTVKRNLCPGHVGGLEVSVATELIYGGICSAFDAAAGPVLDQLLGNLPTINYEA